MAATPTRRHTTVIRVPSKLLSPKQVKSVTPEQRKKLEQPLWVVDSRGSTLKDGLNNIDFSRIDQRIWFRTESEVKSQLHRGTWIRTLTLCSNSKVIGYEYDSHTEFVTDRCNLGPRQLITHELLIELGCDLNFNGIKTHLYMFPNPTRQDIITCLYDHPETILQIKNPDSELCKIAFDVDIELIGLIDDPGEDVIKCIAPGKHLTILKLSDTTLIKIYTMYGIGVMQYFDTIPESVQLMIINDNPENIYFIHYPTQQVIDKVHAAGVRTIWSPLKCAYSPKYSFKTYFDDLKTKLNYDEFCKQLRRNKALVYSGVLYSHLTGTPVTTGTPVVSKRLYIIIQGDSSEFVKYINSSYGTYESSEVNVYFTSSVCISSIYVAMTIITTPYDPLSVIMHTALYNIHKIVFDGVGLYTYEKFLGQPIEPTIEPHSFTILNLLHNSKMKYTEHAITHINWYYTATNNTDMCNTDEYVKCYTTAVDHLRGKTTCPKLTY